MKKERGKRTNSLNYLLALSVVSASSYIPIDEAPIHSYETPETKLIKKQEKEYLFSCLSPEAKLILNLIFEEKLKDFFSKKGKVTIGSIRKYAKTIGWKSSLIGCVIKELKEYTKNICSI